MDPYEHTRLEYMWYSGYNKDDEPDIVPDWEYDIIVGQVEHKVSANVTEPRVRFIDREKESYVQSDTVLNLMVLR